MSVRRVTEHVFRISLGTVNVFLVALPDTMTLVDAGTRGSYDRIASAVRKLGRRPEQIADILVTHCHADHTGALAQAQSATGARVWMHPGDASLVASGRASRPWRPAPGSIAGFVARPFVKAGPSAVEEVAVDGEAVDQKEIPAAGGMLPVWTPGHTEGHVVYLWPGDGGVLFVGDAATRMLRLRPAPIYEDYEQGLESLRSVAGLDFEVACFSHGRPIKRGASEVFREMWPAR